MSKKIALFNRKPKEGPQKCPVYLKLPWIGKISLNFEKQTKIAIKRCYQAVEPRIIFTTRKIWPAIHKNVLPSLQQIRVVCQYVCRCDCRYMGRTSPRLQDRINQHIPRCIRSDKRPTKNLSNRESKITNTPTVYSDSAIGQHLLENEKCAKHYNDAHFSILATARSSFHLSVLEATYINFLQPILPSKRIRLFTPNFTLISGAHFRLKQNNIFPPIKSSEWPILTNQNTTKIFYIFGDFFRWSLQHLTS